LGATIYSVKSGKNQAIRELPSGNSQMTLHQYQPPLDFYHKLLKSHHGFAMVGMKPLRCGKVVGFIASKH